MNILSDEFLHRYPRIAIAGGPRTGKTTLADEFRRLADEFRLRAVPPIYRTDDFLGYDRGEMLRDIRSMLRGADEFIIEGCQVAWLLRAGLEVDAALYLGQPVAPRTPEQHRFARSIYEVYSRWADKERKADLWVGRWEHPQDNHISGSMRLVGREVTPPHR